MKNQTYVDNLPIGEVVRNGQVLNAMYRKGIIPEYHSTFKYITGKYFGGNVEYLGNFFTLKFFSGCIDPYLVKTLPPMKRDKEGRRVPTKRIYYKCFKGNFGRKTYGDKLAAACWNLHYKVEKNGFNGKLFEYVCRKFDLGRTSVRKYKGIADHKICLWGAVI